MQSALADAQKQSSERARALFLTERALREEQAQVEALQTRLRSLQERQADEAKLHAELAQLRKQDGEHKTAMEQVGDWGTCLFL